LARTGVVCKVYGNLCDSGDSSPLDYHWRT